MRLSLVRIFAALQLMRIPLAAGAAVNLMFATLLARFDHSTAALPISTLPLWAALLAAAVIGSGLFGFAAGMNDLLDVRRDHTFQRNRPLSTGRLTTAQATLLTFTASCAGALDIFILPRCPHFTFALRAVAYVAKHCANGSTTA